MLKAYATWFTSPNHDRTSVRFFGVGKSLIARVNFWHGLTESAVISKPAGGGCKLEFQWVQSDAV